jgi:VWFA-related protein
MSIGMQWKRVAVSLGVLATFGMFASGQARAAGNTVTITVTAVGKKNTPPPQPVKQEDIALYKNKERIQVADWKRGETLSLAILIDESLDPDVTNQWGDVKAFIDQQAPNTSIAVAYSRNGSAVIAQDFTTDHNLAKKALRIPAGGTQAFSSPYLAVQDWIKRWPDNGGDRRSIIMVSSGVDYFRGNFSPEDPDLSTTIQNAEKKNINVWSIYYPDAGHFGRRRFQVFNSQYNLSRLAEETGAESYYLDYTKPVSFKPYLDEIQEHLNNQYLLAFDAGPGGKKGKFEGIRVTSELKHLEFFTFHEAFVPASE